MGLEDYLTASVLFGAGLVTGLIYRKIIPSVHTYPQYVNGVGSSLAEYMKKRALKVQALSRRLTEGRSHKMVLVVRTDLAMGKGKIAAQCSHAAVGCFQQALLKDPESLDIWDATGCVKICLKADGDEKSLLKIQDAAEKLKIVTMIVKDAGHTQVAPGTITVLGVGPAPATEVDKVTGHLKLM